MQNVFVEVRERTARAGLRGYRLLALTGAALAYFMVQLGMVPVAITLPTVAREFQVDIAQAGWAMTAYLLVLAALALPAGRLGDILGYHRVFFVGVVVYGAATVLTGFAGSMAQFIALRAVQGIGGAILLGTTFAITANAVPESMRGRAVASTAMAASVGSMIGSTTAGLAVTYLNWRWTFFFLLPIAVVTAKIAWDMARSAPSTTERRSTRIDIPGTVLFVGVLVTLVLSLNHLHEGPETFEAGWGYHTTMQVLAAVLLALLLVVESRAIEPLLILRHFRNGLFSSALAANIVLHITMASIFFLLPFVIQRGMVLPPLYISSALVARQILDISAPALSGWLYDRTHSRLIRPIGMAVICSSILTMGLLATELSYVGLVVMTVLTGFGSGFFVTTNNTVILSALPQGERGFATGMLETTRQLGHTVAVVVVTAAMGLALGGQDSGAVLPRTYLEGFRYACFAVAATSAAGIVLASLATRRMRALAEKQAPVPAGVRSGE